MKPVLILVVVAVSLISVSADADEPKVAEEPALAPASEKDSEKTPANNPFASLLEDKDGQLSKMAAALLGKNGGDRLFYFPTRGLPFTPKKFALTFEDVHFNSADGTKLHGWFLPAADGAAKARATVVFSHANAGSMAHHLEHVDWLIPAGYNLLLYDYRAYGTSEGDLSRKGIIEDVRAAFDYVVTRKDIDPNRLISFAHSLGGPKSITAIGMKPVKGLRAVITDGAFASYQATAKLKAGAVGANLTTDDFSPVDYIEKIAPVPVLIVHGTADEMIPVSQGDALFEKAKEPKTYFKVEGGGHFDSLSRNDGEYRKKMRLWIEKALEKEAD